MKYLLPLLFVFGLSANATAQIDYDSIAYTLGNRIEMSFGYPEDEYFQEIFGDSIFLTYILYEQEQNAKLDVFNASFAEQDFSGGWKSDIDETIAAGDYYNFVNYSFDELKNIYLIFRYFGEDGINYHQYLLEPVGIGKYNITDVYVFITGEYFSETLQQIYFGYVNDMIDEDGDFAFNDKIKSIITLGRVKKLMADGNVEKAKKIYYKNIPEDVRNDRMFLLFELQLIDESDDEAYTKLLAKLVESDNGGPSLHLNSIDLYFLKEDYEKALAAVDSVFSYTSDDMLDYYRGNIYFTMGEMEKAKKHFQMVADNYPYLPEIYDQLMFIYDETDDEAGFLNTLDTVGKYMSFDIPALHELVGRDYPYYHEKEAYQNWLEEKMNEREAKIMPIKNQLMGNWVFAETRDTLGNMIETSPYYKDNSLTRPSINFESQELYEKSLNDKVFETGGWTIDLVYNTIDYYVPFKGKSKKGKTILQQGNYMQEDGEFYEILSDFIFQIEDTELLLFEDENVVLAYKRSQ